MTRRAYGPPGVKVIPKPIDNNKVNATKYLEALLLYSEIL